MFYVCLSVCVTIWTVAFEHGLELGTLFCACTYVQFKCQGNLIKFKDK